MSTQQPATPTPAPKVIVLQPYVPVTLQISANGQTYQLTVSLAVNATGGLSINADSSKVTADSQAPIA